MAMTVQQAGLTVIDPSAYAQEHRLHQACALLRRESPVHWVEGPDYNPFWVVTRRADILEIEKNHEVFRNSPRPVLVPSVEDQRQAEQAIVLRTLVHMDDPDHRVLRPIAADWFRPKTLRAMQDSVDVLARRYVDLLLERGGECDFVADVATHYPLSVILSLLGLPECDFPRMLSLTQELFGGDDPQRRRGENSEDQLAVVLDFVGYFQQLINDRRAHRPRTSPPPSPTPRSTASTCPTWTPPRTSSSSLRPATTPPARRSPVGCTRCCNTLSSSTGCAVTRACCRGRSRR